MRKKIKSEEKMSVLIDFTFGTSLLASLVASLSQLISGRLLSEEQIRKISNDAIGKHFKDFLPTQEEDHKNQERVEMAQKSIVHASEIITEIKNDLDDQTNKLNDMLLRAEEKKQLVEKYTALASMAEKQAEAVREELANTIRKELEAQAQKGRRMRQFVSFFVWAFTLILGAALGCYFKELLGWAKGLVA